MMVVVMMMVVMMISSNQPLGCSSTCRQGSGCA
jgi:hypothetical protein